MIKEVLEAFGDEVLEDKDMAAIALVIKGISQLTDETDIKDIIQEIVELKVVLDTNILNLIKELKKK